MLLVRLLPYRNDTSAHRFWFFFHHSFTLVIGLHTQIWPSECVFPRFLCSDWKIQTKNHPVSCELPDAKDISKISQVKQRIVRRGWSLNVFQSSQSSVAYFAVVLPAPLSRGRRCYVHALQPRIILWLNWFVLWCMCTQHQNQWLCWFLLAEINWCDWYAIFLLNIDQDEIEVALRRQRCEET
jgi:hypothetical protein